MAVSVVRGRKVDIVMLAIWILSLVAIGVYVHREHTHLSYRNCLAIENLKAGQREAAQATIAGDLAFLKAHHGGTADFPEKVVRADIAVKQKIVDRYPPRRCSKP